MQASRLKNFDMFLIDIPYLHNGYFRQYLATYVATITLVICGTGIAWPSPVLPQFKAHKLFNVSDSELSWMVSVLYFGNIASPIPIGYLMDSIGRKTSLLILNIIPFASWLIIWFWKDVAGLYIARVLQGLWLGISYTVIPIYLGEIAEPAIRGSISTNFQTLIYVGVLIEYVVGPYVSYELLAIISFIFPIIFFVLFPFIPESPYYYVMKNNTKEAEKALKWLRNSDADTSLEVQQINAYFLNQREKKKNLKALIFNRPTMKAFLIVSVLSIFQRFSGIGTMMAYGSMTLPAIGPFTADECMMVVCVVWIVFGFSSQFLADKFTRKTLLVVSSIGAFVSNCLAAVWFAYWYDEQHAGHPLKLTWAPFVCFVIFGASYSIGIGPIVTTIKGEIFPSQVKGVASGVTTIIMALSSFVVNKIYQPLYSGPGMYVNFVIYSIISILNIIFTLTVVIETKGKTLEGIQNKLNRKKTKNVATIQERYEEFERV